MTEKTANNWEMMYLFCERGKKQEKSWASSHCQQAQNRWPIVGHTFENDQNPSAYKQYQTTPT